MKPTSHEVQKPDDATLIVRRVLNAPPERAFRAWTSPEHVQQWMRPQPGMVVPLVIMELRVGGKYRIQTRTSDGEYFTAVGVFQEVTPPERLVYTWDWEKDGSGTEFGDVEGKPSLVTVEFLKHGEQTQFVLTHSRFAAVASRDNHARGWGDIVESFATLVEQGT
jgi:uncharacterized protein YndB with AHSA1/START domain